MKLHTIEYTTSEKPDFAQLYSAYQEHGAILLRDSLMNLDNFEALTNFFCDTFHHVGGRSAMRQDKGDGFTTSVWPGNMEKLAHTEGSFRPVLHRPDTAFFCCLTPPASTGGETTLFDGAEMLALIPEELSRRLMTQGIIYEMTWKPERWGAEFNIDNEAELRQFLTRFPDARYTLNNNILHLFYTAPAIVKVNGISAFANGILNHLPGISHPAYTGKPVYTKSSNRVYFGDGEPLSDDVFNTLIDVQDQVVYKHTWKKNDVVVVNNMRYMHGRTMTAEPCERSLLSRFGLTRQGETT